MTAFGTKIAGLCLWTGLVLAHPPAVAQSALDAASALAGGGQMSSLNDLSFGLSGDDMLDVLEDAAADGDPLALWRLGVMYESGIGVTQDQVKAFGYFSRIANENANTPPRSLEADIVAQSFVKIGDYYRMGLPGAGISANATQSRALLVHAASYFGDPDAQFRLGLLFLEEGNDKNPLQGARWLSLAAQKGHLQAQAVLGDILFNGEGVTAQPIEGLMWLTLAQDGARGSADEPWVAELVNRAMSIASPDQRQQARNVADSIRSQIGRR